MMKLIAAGVFTMFVVAGIASRGASAGSQTNCFPPYQECTAGCDDFIGNAKGACLRMCRAEYDWCLAH